LEFGNFVAPLVNIVVLMCSFKFSSVSITSTLKCSYFFRKLN
jgi:hypothetical protein